MRSLRNSILSGLLFGLVVFAPGCTIAEINAWRAAENLPAIPADHPDRATIVRLATVWFESLPEPEPPTIREIVWRTAEAEAGWGHGSEWGCIQGIVGRETGETWKPTAQNPRSSAYGLFQLLDSTWGPTGVVKTSDPAGQTVAGVRYIANRYGTPCNALAFHANHGFY